MFSLAAGYPDALSLGIGEPDFPTPEHIREAGKRALDEGRTKYTPNAGIPELRRGLAEKLSRENGLVCDPERNLVVTSGACEAIMLSLLGLVEPGDEVLVPDPGWPNYYGQVHMAGGMTVPYPLLESERFHVRAEHIAPRITPRTRLLLLNSPGNPTGAVTSPEELREVADLVIRHDLTVISDEPYEKFLYDGARHLSPASLPGMAERVLTVNSFSKTYSMTGWRVGYIHGPEEVVTELVKLQEGMSACVTACAQWAALEALRGSQDCTRVMVEAYRRRRDLLVEGLNRLPGVHCILPEGAFYAFANVEALGSSQEVAMDWLRRGRVVVVPGSGFGPHGEGYVRLCFAASEDTIREALGRLAGILG